ncbi:MAG: hypothetical protein WCK39_00525 [Methanomassiliicoccales archaeon]
MDYVISDQVKEIIAKRGLKQADVEDVIKSGIDLKQTFNYKGTNRHLACKKINGVTVYADFELESGILKKKAILKTAYSHRVSLNSVQQLGEASNWLYNGNPVHSATVELEYMTVKRSGPALASADGKLMMVEEYLATKTLAAAEGLFEKKRA